MSKRNAIVLNPHFRPQTVFLESFDGYKFNLENFQYKHENQTNSKDALDLSRGQRELIRELYKDDVMLYRNFDRIEALDQIL